MPGAESKLESVNLSAIASALDHARTMVIHSAEIRLRNFNLFIIITGALVTGLAKFPSFWWNAILESTGILCSLLFLGIDMRGTVLLTYSSRKIERLEPVLWEHAGIDGWTPSP